MLHGCQTPVYKMTQGCRMTIVAVLSADNAATFEWGIFVSTVHIIRLLVLLVTLNVVL